jgi:hypothetical protein
MSTQKEFELVDNMVSYLNRFFHIEREVNIDKKINGHNRPDLLLTNKQNEKIKFIVEVKRYAGNGEHKRGNDYVALIEQANSYAQGTINGIRYPVLIYPPISGDFLQPAEQPKRDVKNMMYQFRAIHDDTTAHHNINSILSFNYIGEIRLVKDRFEKKSFAVYFMYNNITLWQIKSYYKTVYEYDFKNYYKLQNKLNHGTR